jgi:acyl-CoA synthetase (AMP-forming)/AMP-acid ligase II
MTGCDVQGYGMTESNAITALNFAAQYIAKPSSCGKPVAIVDVRIADDDLKPLPANTPGEILIRGPTVMKGAAAVHCRARCVSLYAPRTIAMRAVCAKQR